MLAKAFVIAMAADIARSDYAKPTLIRSRSREWLIACRWGPDGEYLSIATAGPYRASRGGGAAGHCADPQPVRRTGFRIGTQSPARSCWCASCRVRSNLPVRSFPPTATCCCRTTTRSILSARRATRTAAAGSTARKFARTFPIRRLPRPRPCPGISRRRGVTGSASSFPAAGRRAASNSRRPVDACDRTAPQNVAGTRSAVARGFLKTILARETSAAHQDRQYSDAQPWPSPCEFERRCFQPASRCSMPHTRTGRSRISLENAHGTRVRADPARVDSPGRVRRGDRRHRRRQGQRGRQPARQDGVRGAARGGSRATIPATSGCSTRHGASTSRCPPLGCWPRSSRRRSPSAIWCT